MDELKAEWSKYLLHFKEPSGTSRGILTDKETYFTGCGMNVIRSCRNRGVRSIPGTQCGGCTGI